MPSHVSLIVKDAAIHQSGPGVTELGIRMVIIFLYEVGFKGWDNQAVLYLPQQRERERGQREPSFVKMHCTS